MKIFRSITSPLVDFGLSYPMSDIISVLDASTPIPMLLREDGKMLIAPSVFYDMIPLASLRVWCHNYGRYGVPTTELIGWLLHEIGTRFAIEIGAGCGDLCYNLGITGTDNYQQTFPDVMRHYKLIGQPVISYPKHVRQMDAATAIKHYQPEVVVASWVTEWIDPNLPVPEHGGNPYGVKENEIVDAGITYILIGNQSIHGGKSIMSRPHVELNLPFVRSRSVFPDQNRIWIWNR
jgi:hypothetical protein